MLRNQKQEEEYPYGNMQDNVSYSEQHYRHAGFGLVLVVVVDDAGPEGQDTEDAAGDDEYGWQEEGDEEENVVGELVPEVLGVKVNDVI